MTRKVLLTGGFTNNRTCPFCGGDPVVITGDNKKKHIECINRHGSCPMNMRTKKHKLERECRKEWNTRFYP